MDKNERIWLVGVREEEGEGCQWPMCDLWLCGRRGGGGVCIYDLFGINFGFFRFYRLFINIGYLGLILDGFRILESGF